MSTLEITINNIEDYRGGLKIRKGGLSFDLWSLFNRAQFEASPAACIVPLSKIVSLKNDLLDPKYLAGEKADPRESAFKFMIEAGNGRRSKRAPLLVRQIDPARFEVVDGNATAQVLMLAGWTEIPVVVERTSVAV